MALRTYALSTILGNVASMTAKDSDTLAAATSALAKAVVAFAAVKAGPVKPTAFAAIASVARVTYDDALSIVASAVKGSTMRTDLSHMRAEVVARIRAATIVHDAADDAATVRKFDRIVSALVTIDKHASAIVRPVAAASVVNQ